jgi:hypothetical protein
MAILSGAIGVLDSDVLKTVDQEMAPSGSASTRSPCLTAADARGGSRCHQPGDGIKPGDARGDASGWGSSSQRRIRRLPAPGGRPTPPGPARKARLMRLPLKETAETKANQLLATGITPELIRLQQSSIGRGEVPS